MSLFCTITCIACVIRTGNSRRRRTASSSSFGRAAARPVCAASRLAVATASWIARLTPTPPTGDIACAASPMHSRPGRVHRFSRLIATVSSFTSSHALHGSDSRRQDRRHADHIVAECIEAARLDRVVFSLGDDIGALPVVAAVEGDQHLAGLDPRKQAFVFTFALAGAKPQHIHRRPDLRHLEAGALPHDRMPAVASDGEIGADVDRPLRRFGVDARSRYRPTGSDRSPRSFIITLSEAKRWPLSRRKLRKSHCGMKAMKGYLTFRRLRSAMRIELAAELAVHLLQLLMRQLEEAVDQAQVRPSPAASRDARCRRENPGRSRHASPAPPSRRRPVPADIRASCRRDRRRRCSIRFGWCALSGRSAELPASMIRPLSWRYLRGKLLIADSLPSRELSSRGNYQSVAPVRNCSDASSQLSPGNGIFRLH